MRLRLPTMDPLEPSPRDQYGELSMQMDAEQENTPFTLQSSNVKLCIKIICIVVFVQACWWRTRSWNTGLSKRTKLLQLFLARLSIWFLTSHIEYTFQGCFGFSRTARYSSCCSWGEHLRVIQNSVLCWYSPTTTSKVSSLPFKFKDVQLNT